MNNKKNKNIMIKIKILKKINNNDLKINPNIE